MKLTIDSSQDVMAASPTVEETELTSNSPLPTQTETATDVATVEISTAISPTAEDSLILESTQESTAAPVSPTADMTAAPSVPDTETVFSHLSGSITVSQPLMQAVVTIVGAAGQQTIAVQDDGSFAVDIPAGNYHIIFSAPHYLSYTLEGTIPAQAVTFSPVTLVDGDVDGNGIINGADVALVAKSFGLTVPPAATAVDLNGDQVVNIYDLALVNANAHEGQ